MRIGDLYAPLTGGAKSTNGEEASRDESRDESEVLAH